MELTVRAQKFFARISLWPLAVGSILVFNTTELGFSDLGYRLTDIKVELAQKFPPAIAFQILEDIEAEEEHLLDQQEKIILLKAGFPQLAPLHLDEVKIVFNAPATQPLALSGATIKPFRKPSEAVFDDVEFTTEEKKRLALAQRDYGLDIEERTPRYEVSFRERMKQVVEDFSGSEYSTEEQKVTSIPKGDQKKRQNDQSQLALLGEIEFAKDGQLAMTDQHYIDVRRFEEGVAKEVAQVDLSSATFKINVANSKGIIVARLTNQRGGIEGEGIIPVRDLLHSEKPRVVLKRRLERGRIQVQSADGELNPSSPQTRPPVAPFAKRKQSDQKENPKKYEIESLGLVNLLGDEEKSDATNLDPSSEMILESFLEDHIPSLAIVPAGPTMPLTLIPKKALGGLKRILAEQDISFNFEKGEALVWGRVTENGRPIEGARIKVEGALTLYFGAHWVPDTQRSETSANGLFAVLLKETGWTPLQVETRKRETFVVNSWAQAGRVTQVWAESPISRQNVVVRTFDAFSGEPLSAFVDLDQTSQDLDIGGSGVHVAELPAFRGIQFVRARSSSEYEPVLMNYSLLYDYLHIPLIKRNWLDEIKNQLQNKDIDQTGSLVGFVQGDDFIVEVKNSQLQKYIVYFNAKGQIQSQGSAGGGFALFGLDEQARNLTVISRRTGQKIGRIVTPSQDFVQVVIVPFE